MSKLKIEAFYDPDTFTLSYILWDEATKDAAVIDSVLDYDQAGSTVHQASVNKIIDFLEQNSLKLQAILDTHAHADHLSASKVLKNKYPHATLAIGKHITRVQQTFKTILGLEDLLLDGSQFDLLLDEKTTYEFGSLKMEVIFTPGHTPACTCFYFDKKYLFSGDTLFMPDYGTGRCDFPMGSAEALYESIQKLYALPDDTQVYTGHDYQPGGRELKYLSTIKEQKEGNIHLTAKTTREEFVTFRKNRDATLKAPRLLFPSLNTNVRAGELPPVNEQGQRLMHIPVSVKED